MTEIRSFKDLTMWQKSKELAVNVYKITESFPKKEEYGLENQIRRAAISIPSNIAEGFRRRSPADKIHFLRMAYGSGAEIETQLIISKELGYLKDEEIFSDLEQIMKMLNVVIGKL